MNLEFKGTCAPWVVKEGGEWGKYQVIDQRLSEEKRSVICEVFDTFDCAQFENAKIIAAAPELLNALINLNKAIDMFWNKGSENKEHYTKIVTVYQQKSLEIIKKAL